MTMTSKFTKKQITHLEELRNSRQELRNSPLFGKIKVKQVRRPNGKETIKPEHDDLLRISQSTGQSPQEVRQEVFAASADED